jgi:hypothetical protein
MLPADTTSGASAATKEGPLVDHGAGAALPDPHPAALPGPALVTSVKPHTVGNVTWCQVDNVAFHRNQSHRHKVPTFVLTTNQTAVRGCMDWYQTEAVDVTDLRPLRVDPGFTILDFPVAIVDSEVFGWHAGVKTKHRSP